MKYIFVIAVILVCALAAQHDDHAASGSDQGKSFVIIGGHMYYISTALRVTWSQAITECRDLGMVLVSLENGEKDTLIYDYLNIMPGYTDTYWTSGASVHGAWYWTNRAEHFSYANWSQGEPSNNTELCMFNVVGDPRFPGRDHFHAAFCDDNELFICEYACNL